MKKRAKKKQTKIAIPFDDIIDNWDELSIDTILPKLDDVSTWGKALSYTFYARDEYDAADEETTTLLYDLHFRIPQDNILASEVPDFVSLLLQDAEDFLNAASTHHSLIRRDDIEYSLIILGLLKVRSAVPLLLRFTQLKFYVQQDRRENFECEYYSHYRKRALNSLWQIGGDEFAGTYLSRINDIHYEVSEVALSLLFKIKSTLILKILKIFHYNYLDSKYYVSWDLFSGAGINILTDNLKYETLIDSIIFPNDAHFYRDIYSSNCFDYLANVFKEDSLELFFENLLTQIVKFESYHRLSRVGGLLYKYSNDTTYVSVFVSFLEKFPDKNDELNVQLDKLKEYIAEKSKEIEN